MKLDRLHEYVTVAAATLAGMMLAVVCGYLSGRGQANTLGLIIGATVILILMFVARQSVWVLLLGFWAFDGQIPALPVPFAARDILVGVIGLMFFVFIALKVVRQKVEHTLLDLIVGANILYLVITFLRNPVGVEAFGSELVGGRPYFTVFIAMIVYWILARVRATDGELRFLPIVSFTANAVLGVVNLIAYYVPWTGPIIAEFYNGVNTEAYRKEGIATVENNDRINQLAGVGGAGASMLSSYFRPITLVLPFYIFRFSLFTLCMLAVLFSGHRSALVYIFLFFVTATYYRDGSAACLKLLVGGVALTLFTTTVVSRVVHLPFAIQRTLSWLPGDWDAAAVADSKHSTAWRIEIWKTALADSTYIRSRFLGDGFGFTKRDLAAMAQSEAMLARGVGPNSSIETALRVGQFHSGPLSTIRYVGIAGLVLYFVLIIYMAVMSHRLLVRAKEHPCYPSFLFALAPNVYLPFTFVAVFGSFDIGFPTTVMGAALLGVFQRATGIWEREKCGADRALKTEATRHREVFRRPVAAFRQ